MRLYLKNIGKLKEADIKLDGITVVAGENNAGKSTVGKALYAVCNSFDALKSSFDEKVDSLRTKCFHEVNDQITHLFSENESILRLFYNTQSGEDSVIFDFAVNELLSIEGSVNFIYEVLYIDNPYILDEISTKSDTHCHRGALQRSLKKSTIKDQVLQQILAEKNQKNILSLLDSVCEGELSFQNTVRYSLGKTGESLDIKNLSNGLKSFAILKALLLNGSLFRGSVLILEEPENHLHPEWQLIYAELIVLLQKEFKITILLTTHSPYFLRALEVYSEVHEITDKCNYYFAENEGQEAMIYDVTENKSEVFRKLSRPLQKLENLRWRNDT